jgi:hypothetical protein
MAQLAGNKDRFGRIVELLVGNQNRHLATAPSALESTAGCPAHILILPDQARPVCTVSS